MLLTLSTKALKAFIKPFKAPQRSVKINCENLCLFQYNFQKCTGREGLKLNIRTPTGITNDNKNPTVAFAL